MKALSSLRVPLGQGEYDIHTLVKLALEKANLAPRHEVYLGARKRIDFVCGTVGIEVKRGRPSAKRLVPQIEKYLSSSELTGMIVIVERTAALPRTLCGKPVRLVSLNKLWGIGL